MTAISNDHKFQFVACASLRYCFGRQTYGPSLYFDWFRENIKSMSQSTIDLAMREIADYLRDKIRGDYTDESWFRFYDYLKELKPQEK